MHIENFISNDKIKQLSDEFNRVHIKLDLSKNQWNSLYDLPYEESLKVSKLIRELLSDSFSKYFCEFETPIATFMSKNPISNSTCELHRDFTLFDESQVQFRNFWIPLIDINSLNGALYVIPGSHKIFTDIRPVGEHWPYNHLKKELMNYKKAFYPKAGDLILYADKTLHGSFENKTKQPRPVLHGAVLPKKAQLYYYQCDNQYIKKYKVNLDFYMKGEFSCPEKINKYPIVDEFLFAHKKVQQDVAIREISALFETLK